MTVRLSALSEARLLMDFWSRVHDGKDRLALLQRYAAIGLRRPPEWDRAMVRAEVMFDRAPLECFCCRHRDRVINWHHVIQVQHGGSNHGLNLVGICDACHARVHPWLSPDVRVRRRGLVWVRDLIAPFMDWMEQCWRRSA